MGFGVFRRQPSASAVREFLARRFREEGCPPRHLVTDHGKQFVARAFKRWCRRRGIRQRFGAIGKYGSLAMIERAIRTFKSPTDSPPCIMSWRSSPPGTTDTDRTPGSERPRLTRSTIVAALQPGHRASSRARASQESASRSSSAISRGDGICPSSP
jgi:transposase InsO family protein